MVTWCVWARVPTPGKSMQCWSRMTGGLTEDAATLYAEQTYFQSTVMTDQEAPSSSIPLAPKTRRY